MPKERQAGLFGLRSLQKLKTTGSALSAARPMSRPASTGTSP
jgi:hypothetical protein